MSRRVRKKTAKNLLILTILLVVAYFAHDYLNRFDPEKIVEDSELGGRTFASEVVEITSPQGIKAYLMTENTNPIISISFLFAGVGTVEGASLTSQIITEGAGQYSSQEFKEQLEENAVSIGYSVSKDDFSGRILTLKENAGKAWELFKLTLDAPLLAPADFARIKESIITSLQREQEIPQRRLSLLAAQKIYGSHPYGKNPLGTKENVENITVAEVKDFISSYLTQDRLVVGIAGDINQEEAEILLDKLFGFLPKSGKAIESERPMIDYTTRLEVEDNLPQNISIIVAKSTPRLADDFYPLYIANRIIGGSGLTSRLNQIAREQEGLTYGIYTTMANYDQVELIMGGFSATADNYSRLQEIILNEWENFGLKGVGATELADAKDYLVASYNLRFADITNLSEMLVYMQKDKLGIDFLKNRNSYVKAVTKEQVNQAAHKYYNPKELIIISTGKFNQGEQ